METRKRKTIIVERDDDPMTPSQVLLGFVMAAATIYGAWCSVSLLLLVLR